MYGTLLVTRVLDSAVTMDPWIRTRTWETISPPHVPGQNFLLHWFGSSVTEGTQVSGLVLGKGVGGLHLKFD